MTEQKETESLRYGPRLYISLFQRHQDYIHDLSRWTGRQQSDLIRELIELAHDDAAQAVKLAGGEDKLNPQIPLKFFLPTWYNPNHLDSWQRDKETKENADKKKLQAVKDDLDELKEVTQFIYSSVAALAVVYELQEEPTYKDIMAAITQAAKIGERLDQLREFQPKEITWLRYDLAPYQVRPRTLPAAAPPAAAPPVVAKPLPAAAQPAAAQSDDVILWAGIGLVLVLALVGLVAVGWWLFGLLT